MPSFAVEKCRDVVVDMANIAVESFNKATLLIDNFDNNLFKEVENLEAMVDKYEDKTSTYLIKIAANNMSSKDSKIVTELLEVMEKSNLMKC